MIKLDWYARDKKIKRVRLNTRWKDSIVKFIGSLWKIKAQDREKWKYCHIQIVRCLKSRVHISDQYIPIYYFQNDNT